MMCAQARESLLSEEAHVASVVQEGRAQLQDLHDRIARAQDTYTQTQVTPNQHNTLPQDTYTQTQVTPTHTERLSGSMGRLRIQSCARIRSDTVSCGWGVACQAKCQRMTAELASMEREAQLRTLEAQRDRDQRQVTQQ
jgi:hypothetical protein